MCRTLGVSAVVHADFITRKVAVLRTTETEGVTVVLGTTEDPPTPRWLLPIPEACAGLGVGRSTLYELAAAGELEIVHIGRRALVPVGAIAAYVERLRGSSEPQPAA